MVLFIVPEVGHGLPLFVRFDQPQQQECSRGGENRPRAQALPAIS